VRKGAIIERPKNYTIDAEIGRLHVDVFEIKEGSQKVFSSGENIFPETGPREAYKSVGLKELIVLFACDESFRKSEKKLNRVLHRQEKSELIQSRTMANLVEQEGDQLQAQVLSRAKGILEVHGLSTDGSLTDPQKAFESIAGEGALLAEEEVCEMIEELNRGKEKEKCIEYSELQEVSEDLAQVKAYISLDDRKGL
jgi:hypothetical protein